MLELVDNEQIRWEKIVTEPSFWLMVATSLLVYVYYKAEFADFNSLQDYKKKDFAIAYIRKACLEEYAEKCREHIRDGNLQGIKDIMDVI